MLKVLDSISCGCETSHVIISMQKATCVFSHLHTLTFGGVAASKLEDYEQMTIGEAAVVQELQSFGQTLYQRVTMG